MFLTRVVLAAAFSLVVTSFALAGPTVKCDGIARYMVIEPKPVQVNPGGRCAVQLQMDKGCYFARAPGGKRTYGPFCLDAEKGKGGGRVPLRIEWVWSDGPRSIGVIILGGR